MAADYARSDQFRGARIHLCDLAGLEIRDCEVSGLKIVDCYGGNIYLGGDFERLVVNDVDVTAYVEGELDRQHPTRVLAREAASPDDYRGAWNSIETLWEATLDRARLLPEAMLHEQVDGEWSFVETQRHLLFANDAWLGSAVLEEEAPYHPWGFPAGGMEPDAAAKLGLSLDATPTLDEVLVPRLARMATLRRVVEELTEAELDRVCGQKPAQPYPDREYVVRRCLTVVLKEEAEHHRYAVRDLTVLEDRRNGHLRFRALRPTDVEFVRGLAQDERVIRYVGNGQPWRDTYVQQRFSDALANGNPPDRELRWFIAETPAGSDVGLLALTMRPHETEIGYWVSPACWGNGYGTRILEQALTIAGKARPALPVTATVHRENLASRHLLENAGFVAAEPDSTTAPDELAYQHPPITTSEAP
jgi:RimJ/RimL family protein N-acetyltransferase